MSRILTGIQSSGRAHLGNILGAIRPALRLAQASGEPSFLFIADLHALTTERNAQQRIEHTRNIAACWLACGLDTEKDVFYRQSRIPEVCELAWYLNCFAPYPMLANAHSFKDKQENLSNINAGLFTYPVLMAADILMYDAHFVPVGKDQRQHLEITRDIAETFNRQYPNTLIVPEAKIQEDVMTVPGTDGRKMSKSYGNYIDIFLPEKELRKKVMSIVTDSTPVEAPKNPDVCNVFALFKLIAPPNDLESLRADYLAGGMGYGKAKEALFQALLKEFATEREAFFEFEKNPDLLEQKLQEGEAKAREVGFAVLDRIRKVVGFR